MVALELEASSSGSGCVPLWGDGLLFPSACCESVVFFKVFVKAAGRISSMSD